IEVHLFDFAVGSHHGWRAPERNRERSIGHQVDAWNVGMMDPLLSFCVTIGSPLIRGIYLNATQHFLILSAL
ncbi:MULTISPECIES: hypothetical protein, partial [Pseudomonas]|uniref:hypothetical protein n=1 Tax=Pseudomonas TaxID=286 RepID=UPI00211B1961